MARAGACVTGGAVPELDAVVDDVEPLAPAGAVVGADDADPPAAGGLVVDVDDVDPPAAGGGVVDVDAPEEVVDVAW